MYMHKCVNCKEQVHVRTLNCHFLFWELPVSISKLMELHESEASMYTCCPVLYPQMTGTAELPAQSHIPPLFSPKAMV